MTRRSAAERERSGPVRPSALAAALGGTSVLLAASVLGLVLALAEKALCWSGAWNDYAEQFQRACYTDIYPLYYGEGLSAGKVPYTGHQVEYPVLIGGAMQAAAWLAAAALAWLAVDLPVMIAAPSGWAYFYAFSKDRGADWGSIWYMLEHFNVPVLGNGELSALNKMSAAFFAAACVAIAVLALAAPRRPRLPQLCFLVLAAFLMTDKVWSPQYVVWLVPLAVLARPRLWPYLLWQLAEIAYFFGIWGYLIFVYFMQGNPVTGYHGISSGWYFAALLARFLTVSLLAAYVVRDIIDPERDVVRALGHDDPAGGVLDHAEDRFRGLRAAVSGGGLRRAAVFSPWRRRGPWPRPGSCRAAGAGSRPGSCAWPGR
jgi:hypothetical protein